MLTSSIDPLRYSGGAPVQTFEPESTEVLSVSAVAAATTTLASSGKNLAIVTATTWVHMAWGATPTATSADMLLPPGSALPWIFEDPYELSFIKVAGFADGIVSVTVVKEIS